MAKSVVRGKALVAKFRADPSVRDPEALAAYAGRRKALRKATKGKLKHKSRKSKGRPNLIKGASHKDLNKLPLADVLRLAGVAKRGDTFTTGSGTYKKKFKVL